MSSTLFQESRVMLAELLLSEKDATRVWLRAEMDRLVEPMLDSIYDRLNNKLANGLERIQSGVGSDYHQKKMIQDDNLEPSHNQMDQAAILNVQPSTSFHLNQSHQNVHYSHKQPNGSFVCNDNSNQQSEIRSLSQPTMFPSAQVNFDEHSNVSSGQVEHPLLASGEQSNPSLKDPNWDGEDEGDEECDCDDCVNGGIEAKEENEDNDNDDESVQLIDDDEDKQELACPVKKPRMDSTQPNNAQPKVVGVSQMQPTEDSQPNEVIDHDKHFITVHLRCPESECPETFTETELNDHLMEKHLIGPKRCLVKECKQSFDNQCILRQHIKQSHRHITKWHCNKCSKHFITYHQLSIHNTNQHELGRFQCSFPLCTFFGECKMKVYNHYVAQHKPDLVCQQSGCHYRTKKSTYFKTHQRAHLGIKPYHCKWPNCKYSNSSRNAAMMHIKHHFNSRTSSRNVALSDKPSDYLEVVHSLL